MQCTIPGRSSGFEGISGLWCVRATFPVRAEELAVILVSSWRFRAATLRAERSTGCSGSGKCIYSYVHMYVCLYMYMYIYIDPGDVYKMCRGYPKGSFEVFGL